MNIETKKLGNYTLDIISIQDFKEYYYDNKDKFSAFAENAFLRTLDIPPKFFKEQPEETQKELLDNREFFVAERKKFIGKVIVVLRSEEEGEILNACRLGSKEAEENYKALSSIEAVKGKFEHRSFIKDGYTSIIISEDIEKGVSNHVLAIDFPVLLNKKPVIHKALYTLPDDTFAVPVEHIQYTESSEVILGEDYSTLEEAIKDNISFLKENEARKEAKNILREPELVAIALVETGVIPAKYSDKVKLHIEKNCKGTLTTESLEKLILDFDEEFRRYKQLTSLRSINGNAILEFLESDKFKELEKMMDDVEELATL